MTIKPLTYFIHRRRHGAEQSGAAVSRLRGAVDSRGGAMPASSDREDCSRRTAGATDMWRNGIYPFVHYHSHDPRGARHCAAAMRACARRTMSARTFELKAGDVVVLPAGTGHQRLVFDSDDLLVIGAYPPEGTTISAAATSRPSTTRRWRPSRACRCRKPIRCSARTGRCRSCGAPIKKFIPNHTKAGHGRAKGAKRRLRA